MRGKLTVVQAMRQACALPADPAAGPGEKALPLSLSGGDPARARGPVHKCGSGQQNE
jgi:hypothetical protein